MSTITKPDFTDYMDDLGGFNSEGWVAAQTAWHATPEGSAEFERQELRMSYEVSQIRKDHHVDLRYVPGALELWRWHTKCRAVVGQCVLCWTPIVPGAWHLDGVLALRRVHLKCARKTEVLDR